MRETSRYISDKMNKNIGKKIFDLIKRLYPICRSLTGNGNKKTLNIIKKIIPKLKILKFKSGTKVFDWKIPDEWNVNDAYIISPKGKKIANFKNNNLHLVNYSIPIKKKISLKNLKKKIFYYKNLPSAIPYVTSYYKRDWGFCLTYNQFKKLKPGNYKAFIDTNFNKNGNLVLGEYLIKGRSKKEILISCNICHPSMVNNELSGPSLLTYLIKKLESEQNFYSIRCIFIPETIGAITYLSKKIKHLQKYFYAGFHLTCIGDSRQYSIIESKSKNSYSDKIAKLILKYKKGNTKIYSFFDRGSDERQYNSPGINLSVVTLMRSRFGSFKEYHSSMDNLNITSEKTLIDSFNYVFDIIKLIQNDFLISTSIKCEPFLSKRNLYRNTGLTNPWSKNENLMFDLLSYADNIRLSELAIKFNKNPFKLIELVKFYKKKGLLKINLK